MGHRWKLLSIIAVCVVLAIGAGYWISGRASQKGKSGGIKEQGFSLQDITMNNLVIVEGGVISGEDPQLVLPQLNAYVETVRLEGIQGTEGIQVFYTVRNVAFSEQDSFLVTPEVVDGGAQVYVGREVVSLRLDFTGAAGSFYPLSGVTLSAAEASRWDIWTFLLSAFVGLTVGMCLAVVSGEGRRLGIYLQAFRKYRYLLEDMVARDIKLKYRRSVIGLLWSVLNPLLMMCVITAVFRGLFRVTVENFAVYYLTGWVVFNFVTEATTGGMNSILGAGGLIRKVYIPKYIFPVQKCVFSFVNMLFSLVALFAVMLVLRVEFTWKLLLIPVPLFLALAFSVGIGMVLATAAVFFRDVIHLYTVFTMVWMYLTPIIYPIDILSDAMLTVVRMNPMYYYVEYFRKLTLYGVLPGAAELGMMVLWAAASLLFGAVVFKRKQDRFILFI